MNRRIGKYQDMLKPGWQERFWERLGEYVKDGNPSPKSLSKRLGFGINYIYQVLDRPSIPRADHFEILLNELGPANRVYIETGLEVSDEVADAVEILLELRPEDYRVVLRFLQSLRNPATQ